MIKDANWRPELAIDAAMQLIQDDAVSAIVSMTGSHARRAVSSHTAGKCPFIYTPNLEVSTHEPGTIAISATDDQMIAPILDWIFERLSPRRFVMVGSDYRWPLKTMPMTAAMIRARGGSVDQIMVRPIDSDDEWDLEAAERIRTLEPDLVFAFLIGDQAISFHKNFQASGLASKIPRFAIATDETVLMSLDPNTTEGLFAGACYFASARTDANIGFMERYWTAFGELAPIPGFYGQSCYEGVQFAAGLIKTEKTSNPSRLVHGKMRAVAFQSARFDTPIANLTTRLPVYIAKANGNDFDVVARF